MFKNSIIIIIMTVTGIIYNFLLALYRSIFSCIVMIMHFFTSYNVELLLQSTPKINKE